METETRKIYAGVDAGGTKTRLLWKGACGEASGEERFGPLNVNSIGERAVMECVDALCARLREIGDCIGICIGAAGYSNPAARSLIEGPLERFGIGNRILTADWDISLYGALDGAPGLLVIAGTGSVCCGRDASGRTFRTGGWGHLIGDEGSGYALGRDALRAAASMIDGTGPDTKLLSLLEERHGLGERTRIIGYVYGHDKSAVAALSGIVEEAARQGDETADRILSVNADLLAKQIAAAARKISLVSPDIALAGGLLEGETLFRERLRGTLERAMPGSRCVRPANDAVHGALLMSKNTFTAE